MIFLQHSQGLEEIFERKQYHRQHIFNPNLTNLQQTTLKISLQAHFATACFLFYYSVYRSPVSSNTGCQSRGCEFEPQLDQHSDYVEEQPVAWKEFYEVLI